MKQGISMNKNSLLAYNALLKTGKIQANQMAIAEILEEDHKKKGEGLTNKEIADILGWEINRVTPRTNELYKLGVIKREKKKELSGSRKHWINELV